MPCVVTMAIRIKFKNTFILFNEQWAMKNIDTWKRYDIKFYRVVCSDFFADLLNIKACFRAEDKELQRAQRIGLYVR